MWLPWFHARSALRGFNDDECQFVLPNVMINLDKHLVGRVYIHEKCSLVRGYIGARLCSWMMSSFSGRVDYYGVRLVDCGRYLVSEKS
jgi:hypothetical protein